MSGKQAARVPGKRGATCRTTKGQPCGGIPVTGTDPPVCNTHLLNPLARANAAMRAAVSPFAPPLEDAPAGQTLLRMLAYAASRQRYYAGLLARQYDALHDGETEPTLQQEIDLATFSTYGETGSKSGEQIRALHRWEAHWLAETARLAKLALDAGIDERLARLAEDQAELVVQLLRRVVVALGLSPTDPRVSQVVTAELRALDAGTAA